MAAGDMALNILIGASGGGAMSVISNLGKSLSMLASNPLAAVGVAAAAGAAAVIGFGVASVKAAGDFQTGMTQLVTGAGESQAAIGMVSDGILKMAVDTGTSTQQLTSGMYMIESAGYHGAAGLNVLKVAAEGARVGNADLGVTANALTTILTDYHMKGTDAAAAMNGLTATVASGKTKLQDLAGAMGSVLPLASSLGVSFPQVAGAIATMTNAGKDAKVSAQNLANTIRALAAPGSAATKSLKSVGLSAQQLHDSLTKGGLTAAIQLVEEHVGKKFPAGSVQAVAAFKAIMGGATGYNVALMLGGKNMATFEGNVKTITGAMHSGTGAVTGWADVQKDFNFKMDQAKEAVNALMIKVGTALLPVLSNLMSKVTPLIMQFSDWITKNHVIENTVGAVTTGVNLLKDGIQKGVQIVQTMSTAIQNVIAWYNQWKPLILGVAAAIALFVLPALIQMGVQAAIAGATMLATVIPALISMATEGIIATVTAIPGLIMGFIGWAIAGWAAAAATIAATWPILLIILAIALLVVGIILLVQHWSQVTAFLKTIWQAFTNWLMGALHATGEFFVNIWNGIKAGTAAAWNWIVNAVKTAGKLLLNAILAPFIAIADAFVWLYNHNYYFKALIDNIVGVFKAGIKWIQDAWTNIINWLVGAWETIQKDVATAWQAISNFFSGIWQNYIAGPLRALWNAISGWLGGVIKDTIHGWEILWQKVSGIFMSIWNTYIAGPLGALWNAITGWLGGVVRDTLHGWEILWQKVSTLFMGIWNNYVSKPLSNLWTSISKWFADLGKGALDSGRNFINMLVKGITSGAGAIWNAVTGIAHNIWSALGFHSPTEAGPGADADTWMPNLIKMLVGGLNAGVPAMQVAALHVAAPLAQLGLPVRTSASGAFGLGGGISAGNAFGRSRSSSGGSSGPTHMNLTITMDGKKITEAVGVRMAKEIRIQGNIKNR